MLEPESFYGSDHRIIYSALCALDDEDRIDGDPSVAIVVLASYLRDRELIQRVGGAPKLGELLMLVPSTAQFSELCTRVLNLQRLRRAIEVAHAMLGEAYGPVALEDPQQWLQDGASALQHVADDGPSVEIATAADAALEAIEHAERAHSTGGHAERGIALPWDELQEKTGGLYLGETLTITAATGGGKTLCAGAIAEHFAAHSMYAAGIWSLEMPKRQLLSRMAVARARISAHALRAARLNAEDLQRYRVALEELKSLPMFFDEWRPRRGWRTVESIIATMNRYAQQCPAKMGKPLGLMVLDFIQKLDCSGVGDRRSNREQQLNIASDMLVREAERLNIALIVLCQTNEDGDIREAKSIAHHAHSWWQLEIVKSRTGDWRANVRVAKQRHGTKGPVSFGFDPQSVRFHN